MTSVGVMTADLKPVFFKYRLRYLFSTYFSGSFYVEVNFLHVRCYGHFHVWKTMRAHFFSVPSTRKWINAEFVVCTQLWSLFYCDSRMNNPLWSNPLDAWQKLMELVPMSTHAKCSIHLKVKQKKTTKKSKASCSHNNNQLARHRKRI